MLFAHVDVFSYLSHIWTLPLIRNCAGPCDGSVFIRDSTDCELWVMKHLHALIISIGHQLAMITQMQKVPRE